MSRRKLNQQTLVTAALRRPNLDQRRLEAARLWAAAKFPYLAHALFAMRVRSIHRSGTVVVDSGWTLRIDPELVKTWSAAELGSMLLHHVGHLLRDHGERARSSGVTREQSRRWTVAADAEINDDLIGADLEPPDEPVLPATLGCPPHLLAEQYFHAPWEFPRRHTRERECGSGADGWTRQWDDDEAISPGQRNLVRYQTATGILNHNGLEPGTVPADLLRWAEATLDARIDWRRILAAEIRRGVALIAGVVDYSYHRPARRSSAVPGVILPSLVSPTANLAVVIDTSGSMSRVLLGKALAEVDSILRRLGQRRTRVIPCDSSAKGVQAVASARTIELVGGGGTDMGQGIATARALRPAADMVVVLTDGYTPWPDQPPGTLKVIVGLLADGGTPPPAWAKVVRINDTP